MKQYFTEAGFDVLPAAPGRKAAFHDWSSMGLGRFV